MFDSDEDADFFYNMYSRCVGFNVRRGDRKLDKTGGIVTYHKFLCNKHGFREDKWLNNPNRSRKPNVVTRIGCQAYFKVRYDCKTKRYIVTKFVREHSHAMIAHEHGNYDKIRFIKKDMYNRIDADRRKDITDWDAESSIAFLSTLQDMDPMFYLTYDLDEERKLKRLFLCDGQCRVDYDEFGDALVFDITYKTNRY
ncbi:hypothetical protein M9H77_15729 [Catharanthus roseus]|uniref:Uncharacterized protein n=1 Tax=Catharanthus roseus TaxID=4058 RepID=A0ACC0AYP3_CATRO|nr:hypothetical protein M9H77_15729 [Catharanthus roseus]